ncbi:MAG TPA: hypothetical protein DCQ98_03225 [Planctomycetaceae bacterium]|nr:hypothetical protein [Planctomycetaceae bacterium]
MRPETFGSFRAPHRTTDRSPAAVDRGAFEPRQLRLDGHGRRTELRRPDARQPDVTKPDATKPDARHR